MMAGLFKNENVAQGISATASFQYGITDVDDGTGILAALSRGWRAFRRGVAALFTATGGPGGGIPG